MNRKSRIPIWQAAALLILAGTARAEPPVYKAEPSGKPMREWLLLGPITLDASATGSQHGHQPGFESDHLTSAGGEKETRPDGGAEAAIGGENLRWVRHASAKDEIDLDEAISKRDRVAAYAYCEVESQTETPCVLALGTNDGGRLWLNGEQAWDEPKGRTLKPDDDLIPIVLKAGRNRLLLKIEERGNRWSFAARLLPLDAEILAKELRFFEAATRPDGAAILRYVQSPALVETFLKGAYLEAFTREDAQKPVWRASWASRRETPIEVDATHYGEYILKIKTAFAGGATHEYSLPFSAGRRSEQLLFENGKSDYAIILGKNASESERWAAEELRHWIKEASGAELPIREEDAPAQEHEIVVGFNERAKAALGSGARPPEDADESFVYKSVGGRLLIYGGRQRGTMHGAMAFLENELGCRWYTPSVSVVPKKSALKFHRLFRKESPGVRVRNDFYFEAFDPIWAARNRMNGAMSLRKQPGGVEAYWGVHTFYPLVPPDEFFAAHPEYYSLIDGKRTHERAQLCLTNDEVVNILAERLLKVMRENPEYLIYDISQNDWFGACQCDKCQEIVKAEGSESGPVLRAVNEIAERTEKEFPDKFVGTLAYQYTRKPPKTLRPRANVVIRLCSIEACFAHDFTSCPENREFLADLRNWAMIAPHLYIWDYVVNFSHYILPYPNFRVLRANIKTLVASNAIGIMEQAAYQCRGGEFAELRAYLIAKLLWNPDADVDKVITDFTYGYYGRPGQHIRRYMDLLHNQLRADTHIHLGLQPDDPIFSEAFIDQADAIFDEAESVADGEEIARRVEMARLPLMYLKCKRKPEESKRDGTFARLKEASIREGITHFSENPPNSRDLFIAEMERTKD